MNDWQRLVVLKPKDLKSASEGKVIENLILWPLGRCHGCYFRICLIYLLPGRAVRPAGTPDSLLRLGVKLRRAQKGGLHGVVAGALGELA